MTGLCNRNDDRCIAIAALSASILDRIEASPFTTADIARHLGFTRPELVDALEEVLSGIGYDRIGIPGRWSASGASAEHRANLAAGRADPLFPMRGDWWPCDPAAFIGDYVKLQVFRGFWIANGCIKTDATWRAGWARWNHYPRLPLPNDFRILDVMSRAAFEKKLIDAQRLADGGLLVPLQTGIILRDSDQARAASIAGDPAMIHVILCTTVEGVAALVAWGAGDQFFVHELPHSSVAGLPTMANGAAPSSAAPEAEWEA